MPMFAFLKRARATPARSTLATLRETLKKLGAVQEETRQMAELKRILAGRIAELERTSG